MRAAPLGFPHLTWQQLQYANSKLRRGLGREGVAALLTSRREVATYDGGRRARAQRHRACGYPAVLQVLDAKQTVSTSGAGRGRFPPRVIEHA